MTPADDGSLNYLNRLRLFKEDEAKVAHEIEENAMAAKNWEFQRMQVLVRDNNVEQALRVLKKKMQREGLFREMKRASFYEKPSERAAREKSEAIRRARKLARKQAIREGLIAAPVKKLDKKRPTRAAPSITPTSPKLP